MENELQISVRETLHFLGWHGTPIEPELLAQLTEITKLAEKEAEPRSIRMRFAMGKDGVPEGTSFQPAGEDVKRLLSGCHEIILMAATLGAASERALLRMQAQDTARSVLLDAALSAGVEELCDDMESRMRREAELQGLYLTDRFSPGYGDMPLVQCREICAVLDTSRRIGLTVSESGIMIPRKSVTAVLGVSRNPVSRRARGCEGCVARERCPMRRKQEERS